MTNNYFDVQYLFQLNAVEMKTIINVWQKKIKNIISPKMLKG